MVNWMSSRVLHVVTVMVLVSLVAPILPASRMQEATPEAASEETVLLPAEPDLSVGEPAESLQESDPEQTGPFLTDIEQTEMPAPEPQDASPPDDHEPTEDLTEAPPADRTGETPPAGRPDLPAFHESDAEADEEASQGSVAVQVIDGEGHGVADATVTMMGVQTSHSFILTTDGEGTAASGGVASGDYSVRVTATGFTDLVSQLHVNGEEGKVFTFELSPVTTGALAITVLDNTSTLPVQGAEVSIRNADTGERIPTGTSDADGQVTVTDLQSGIYEFSVTHPAYEDGWDSTEVNGHVTAAIRLKPRVAGRITVTAFDDKTGQPITGAEIAVTRWNEATSSNEMVDTGSTDESGTFMTTEVRAGFYNVSVSHDDYTSQQSEVRVDDDKDVTFRLDPQGNGFLTVIVHDDGSNALQGAEVIVTRWANEAGTEIEIDRGTTNESGTFTTGEELAHGDYSVSVHAQGFEPEVRAISISGSRTIEFYLLSVTLHSLTLNLVDAKSDDAVIGASIVIRDATGELVGQGSSDESGVFKIEELPEGLYQAEVSTVGYFPRSEWIYVEDDTSKTIELVSRTPGKLEITVVNLSDNAPVSGAFVDVYNYETGNRVAQGLTDASGKIVTAILPSAEYRIEVEKVGYYTSSGWALVSGPTAETIDLTPIKDGTITVWALNSQTDDPISGAHVVVLNDQDQTVEEGMTDDSGMFVTASLRGGYYSISISKSGFHDSGYYYERTNGPIEVRAYLRPMEDGMLTVLVQDGLTSDMIQGATITLKDRTDKVVLTGVTDADGLFRTVAPLPGDQYTVDVEKDGYLSRSIGFDLSGDRTLDVDLYPPGFGTATVLVTQADGITPIPDAHVVLRQYDYDEYQYVTRAEGVTDAQGHFAPGNELPKGHYYVTVTATGYLEQSNIYLYIDGDSELHVKLDPNMGGILTVHVISRATGEPVSGARVEVREESGGYAKVATGATNEQGIYVTSKPLPHGGSYRIDVTSGGYFDQNESVYVVGDTPAYLALIPRIPGTLTVSVRDANTNDPVSGADIVVRDDNWDEVAISKTDEDGTFVSDELQGDRYWVQASHPEYYDGESSVLVSGDVQSSIQLERRIPGTLTITVLNDDTDQPVTGAEVVIAGGNTHTEVTRGETDDNGVFATRVELEGGDYFIEVTHGAYFHGSTYSRVSGDTEEAIRLEPRIPGTLTVTVIDSASNSPVAGAHIVVMDRTTYEEVTSGKTGDTGTFITSELPGADYRIEAIHEDYHENWEHVRARGETNTTVFLSPRIPGHVTIKVEEFRTGNPVAGATVTITRWESEQSQDVVAATGSTDTNGRFVTTDQLRGGESYSVTVTKPGYLELTTSVYVDGDATSAITVVPDVPGKLTATVKDGSNGTAIPGAIVTLSRGGNLPGDSSSIIGVTGADGTFVTYNVVDSADYTVHVEASGYHSEYSQITLSGNTRADFELTAASPPEDGVLSVRVRDIPDGDPISGATVVIRNQSGAIVAQGTTDSVGKFVTPTAIPGGTYEVTATSDGYSDSAQTLVNGNTREVIRLAKQTGILTTIVLDQTTRTPISGADVTIWKGETPSGSPVVTGTTGDDGTFVTPHPLEPGAYQMRVQASGYFNGPDQYIYISGHQTYTIYQTPFATETPRAITVTVVDEAGESIPGAVVGLARPGSRYELQSQVTDSNGRATFSKLPAGMYFVSARVDGYHTIGSQATQKTEGDETLTVELMRREAEVTAIMRPVASGSYTVTGPKGFEKTGSFTNGNIALGALPSGEGYSLTVNGLGYNPVSIKFDVMYGTLQLQIPLTESSDVTTTVLVQPGEGSAGSTVRVLGAGFRGGETVDIRWNGPDGTVLRSSASTAKGEVDETVTIPSTASAGTYSIVVTGRSSGSSGSASFTVTAPPTATVTPTATSTATATAPTTTPTATATATAPITPTATSTATATATATATSTAPTEEPVEEAPIEVSFTLCGNEDCTELNTSADGYTVSWTVTEQPVASRSAKLASIQPTVGRSHQSLAQAFQESWTITAILQNGVATGLSEPLPLGNYEVCLNPLLVGPDGSTIRIADQPTCDPVTLTAEGGEADSTAAFSTVIIGAPQVIPPATTPDEPATETPADDPATDDPADPVGPATGPETPDSDPDADVADAGVTGLPTTGSGTGSGIAGQWLLVAAAAGLTAAALGVKRRYRM